MPLHDRTDRGAVRPHRYPGQQCRHRRPQAARELYACRMERGHRDQPDRRLCVLARSLSAHEAWRRRQDHQHRLHAFDLRHILRGRLRGEQGRHRADDQSLGLRLGEGQHPGQRDTAGLDRYAIHGNGPEGGSGSPRARRWRARRPAAGASLRILAGIAVFLASPASDFVTGAAIPVDGGYSSQG